MREVFYGATSREVAPFCFMKGNMICSFFGHRDVEITEELHVTVTAEIMKAIDLGCRTFYFGGFGDFDRLCYEVVSKIMTDHPELSIRRIYCVQQERYLHKPSRYFKRQDYDEIIYLPPTFEGWYKSIYYRNCAMIDASDYVVFYAQARENSGAYKAFRYARKQKAKHVVNIYQSNI